jgi:hypothetical protein
MSNLYFRITRKNKVKILCFFKHKWFLYTDTGKTKYSVCSRCDARKIEQSGQGYQPINLDFLDDKVWVKKNDNQN